MRCIKSSAMQKSNNYKSWPWKEFNTQCHWLVFWPLPSQPKPGAEVYFPELLSRDPAVLTGLDIFSIYPVYYDTDDHYWHRKSCFPASNPLPFHHLTWKLIIITRTCFQWRYHTRWHRDISTRPRSEDLPNIAFCYEKIHWSSKIFCQMWKIPFWSLHVGFAAMQTTTKACLLLAAVKETKTNTAIPAAFVFSCSFISLDIGVQSSDLLFPRLLAITDCTVFLSTCSCHLVNTRSSIMITNKARAALNSCQERWRDLPSLTRPSCFSKDISKHNLQGKGGSLPWLHPIPDANSCYAKCWRTGMFKKWQSGKTVNSQRIAGALFIWPTNNVLQTARC